MHRFSSDSFQRKFTKRNKSLGHGTLDHGIRYSEVIQRCQGLRLHKSPVGKRFIRAFSAVQRRWFQSLQEGQAMEFAATKGPKGRKAENVPPL